MCQDHRRLQHSERYLLRRRQHGRQRYAWFTQALSTLQ